jgi:hypothetical protein
MASNGITGDLADEIYDKIEAFANFGFAESHSISFALLVYSSTWFRLHYPAAFLAALLRAQPMGFYSPQPLVADARRHGVEVRRPDLHRSGVDAELEHLVDGQELTGPTGSPDGLVDPQPVVGPFAPKAPFDTTSHRRDGASGVRLGLAEVRTIGEKVAKVIVAERNANGSYASMADLVHRTGITAAQVEALATAGAFECFGLERRQALWDVPRPRGRGTSRPARWRHRCWAAADAARSGRVEGRCRLASSAVPISPTAAKAQQDKKANRYPAVGASAEPPSDSDPQCASDTAATTAMPRAPPIWKDAFWTPDATPESCSATLASEAIDPATVPAPRPAPKTTNPQNATLK